MQFFFSIAAFFAGHWIIVLSFLIPQGRQKVYGGIELFSMMAEKTQYTSSSDGNGRIIGKSLLISFISTCVYPYNTGAAGIESSWGEAKVRSY